MEETFKPHRNMVGLYRLYLLIATAPIIAAGFLAIWLVYLYHLSLTYIPIMLFSVPTGLVAIFVLYWSRMYYGSITYRLTDDEVVVERGVWWKMKHTVPYGRIMSVDIVQGPLSRRLGIATVDVHTAGYTGLGGGTAGPGTRRAEASIIHVSNFNEIREKVLSTVRGRPLFTAGLGDIGYEMLSELRKVREILERSKP